MNTESEKSTKVAAPLRKYVTKLEKAAAAGGNVTFRCNYCEKKILRGLIQGGRHTC